MFGQAVMTFREEERFQPAGLGSGKAGQRCEGI
jgi:hypothetical protein